MFKVEQADNPAKFKEYPTEAEALDFVKRQKKAKGFYVITEIKDETILPDAQNKPETSLTATKTKKVAWKTTTDFSDAVEVNRTNVKNFYKKSGYIRIIGKDGVTILHTGKTKNMGKVFSNYVNCAKYHQSYDFNLDNGDKLLFKEANI